MIDDTLRGVLHAHIPAVFAVDGLRSDDVLIDLGIDSLRLVEFILDLEQAYDIVIPDEDMLGENFSTVAAVSTLVGRLRCLPG